MGSLAASGATTLTANTGSTSTTSGTLVVTGGVGVSGQVTAQTVKSIGDITTEANVVMSNSNAAITHTGASLTVSSDAKVLIESVTFIAGAVSTVTSIGMSDDITMSKGISKITHSGTGGSDKLHIESSSRPVQIEDVTFDESLMTNVGGITTVQTGFTLNMPSEVSAITHSHRSSGQLTISSNQKVLIEDVTFTGSAITGAGAITSNGALTIGGTLSGVTSLAASGATTLTANTASSSKTTGTLVVTGGVGVSGQVTAQTVKSIGDITTEANV